MLNQNSGELLAEIEHLRMRLEEAESTLYAIRNGEVDALITDGPEGEQIFTLKSADYLYRLIIEEMNEGAVALICDGTILYCNSSFARLVRTPLEKVISTSVYNFVTSKDQPILEMLMQQGVTGKSKGEFTLSASDGTLIPVYISLSTLMLGEAQGVCMVVTDLTEQKRNDEIIAAGKLASSILDQAEEAIVVCDAEGRVMLANRAAEQLSDRQLVSQPFDAVFPFGFSSAVPGKRFRKRMSDGQKFSIQTVLGGVAFRGIELNYNRIDGRAISLLVSAGHLLNTQHKINGCVITLADITERKRMESALEEAHEQLERRVEERTAELAKANRQLQNEIAEHEQTEEALNKSNRQIISILESITDAFIAVDHQWRFTYVNEEAEKLFRKERMELLGQCLGDMFSPPFDGTYFDSLNQAMAAKTAVNFEINNSYLGRTFEIHAYPSPDGLSIYCRDITDEKQMENDLARLDRLNLVGEIAASIGHEIRNPLTTVRGFLQLVGGKDDCVKYRDYFNLMIDELDRSNAIISEFLSLAKNKPVDKKAVNLNSVIESLHPLIGADATLTDKYVLVERGNITDLVLDDKEIRQLILNLTRNGLEAMLPGGTLKIGTFAENEEVVLFVRDQGPGINPDVVEKIGTPFLTTKDEGTGLGLAVCYSIAARHNAAVTFDTGPSGTTFYVRFRVKRAEGEPEGAAEHLPGELAAEK